MTRAVALVGRHPWRFFGVYLLVTTALYQLALRAPWREPLVVPALSWDAAVPLLPWTAWPYGTYFALMPTWVVLSARRPALERGRLLLAAGLVLIGNLTIHNLVPTEVGRVLGASEAGGGLLSAIVTADTPRAALPSAHVSLPVTLAVLSFRAGLGRRWTGLFTAWAVMLSIVVLTTRQHVLLDALAGMTYGVVGATLAWSWLRPDDHRD